MARIIIFVLAGILSQTLAQAQNLNTTYRSMLSFPNQTLANIWGYTSRSGHEYALLGASKGLIIVDITNPDAPQQIVQIPGPDNLWKEIKTYSNYAYITSEGGSGIQVVNLKNLPSPNLQYHYYRGDGAILNQLNTIHALHIDTVKGFLYAWGGNLFGGGAKIFDLKPDPYNPVYVGKYDQLGYIHDGFVDNDTMYACHIYAGYFSMVDMTNKSAPVLLATQTTPLAFPHNTWLSNDSKTIIATDEKPGSYLVSYDVSDPTDIVELDRMQYTPGSGSVVHNTYTYKNWAVSSWYTDGFNIVDMTRPDNLVQVANYDTYGGSGSGYNGCWGVYPYFPSGNIIASNINGTATGYGEMWVITPTYKRACYLEGKITDALSGNAINNATIEILGSSPLVQGTSKNTGIYKIGQVESGYYKVKISKAGYQSFESTVLFVAGEVVELSVGLYAGGNYTISGTVLNSLNNMPIQGAQINLYGQQTIANTTTDIDGAFSFSGVDNGIFDLVASHPDFGAATQQAQLITADRTVTMMLSNLFHRPEINERDALSLQSGSFSAVNPFAGSSQLGYGHTKPDARFVVFNANGKVEEIHPLAAEGGSIIFGANLAPGIYFGRIENAEKQIEVIKLVKVQ